MQGGYNQPPFRIKPLFKPPPKIAGTSQKHLVILLYISYPWLRQCKYGKRNANIQNLPDAICIDINYHKSSRFFRRNPLYSF